MFPWLFRVRLLARRGSAAVQGGKTRWKPRRRTKLRVFAAGGASLVPRLRGLGFDLDAAGVWSANPRREGKTRGSEEFARHELNVGTRPEAGRRTRSEHLTNSAFGSPWRARGRCSKRGVGRTGALGGTLARTGPSGAEFTSTEGELRAGPVPPARARRRS